MFEEFARWRGDIEAPWEVNFLGVRTRRTFWTAEQVPKTAPASLGVEPPLPQHDEEYFEWVDLLEAVLTAEHEFVMVELGAGWGRWLMNGAAAARQKRLKVKLIGIEAEPTHFQWMRQHLGDNSVPGESVLLYQAAVASTVGWVRFHVGDPGSWYGQAIDVNAKGPPTARDRLRTKVSWPKTRPERRTVAPVRAITLPQILEDLERVDLIDLDVQGVEADVLLPAARCLQDQVKRVHVGTHDAENEKQLRSLFRDLEWRNLNDFPCGATVNTAFGRISFQDGVQTWLNPHL